MPLARPRRHSCSQCTAPCGRTRRTVANDGAAMLSSYPMTCPHENCSWTGNLVPSHVQGGADAEIASMHRVSGVGTKHCQARLEAPEASFQDKGTPGKS